ncbi:MAG: protein jag [Firmicutes bacterium]|nr:protein jag [Bacillota bacterium]
MREAIGIGATAEIALANACQELGLETHEVEFEVLEYGEKKKFGLFGGKPFKVRAYVQDSPAALAVDYLKKVLAGLGAVRVELAVSEEENGAVITISGEDAGIVIGHHGETLDALQYLVGLVANHVRDEYYRITLNTGNYREKREKTLQALASRLARKALATNRKYSLEPMNPYERRIIHTAVQEIEGATSWSEGADLDRHVVIGPAAGAAARPGRDGNDRGRGARRSSGSRGEKARRPHPEAKPERYSHAVKPEKGRPANNAPVRSVVQASEMDEVLFSAAERGATMPTISDVAPAERAKPETVPAAAPVFGAADEDQVLSTPAAEEKTAAAETKRSQAAEKVPLYGRIDLKK